MVVAALASMSAHLAAALIVVASSLIALAERRLHHNNYAYLKVFGGEELMPDLMRRYYRVQWCLPWVAYLSHFLWAPLLPWKTFPLQGLALILVASFLRLWTIQSLGRLWSQRCLFVPGLSRVKQGPYRLFRHPEYVSRAMEGVGFLLFFGINPISLGLYLWLQNCAAKISKVESRQLYELSVAPLQMPDVSSTV
jgi:methyltransferase